MSDTSYPGSKNGDEVCAGGFRRAASDLKFIGSSRKGFVMSATSRANKKAGRKTTAVAGRGMAAKCPVCGKRLNSAMTCTNCRTMYDSDPDEGGDYYRDPTKRIEVMERRR